MAADKSWDVVNMILHGLLGLVTLAVAGLARIVYTMQGRVTKVESNQISEKSNSDKDSSVQWEKLDKCEAEITALRLDNAVLKTGQAYTHRMLEDIQRQVGRRREDYPNENVSSTKGS